VPAASIDGIITDAADAAISAIDEGLLRGDGVFEVALLYDGVAYALDEHLARMELSARNLRLEFDPEAMRIDTLALLDTSGDLPDRAVVRLVATRGGRRIALIEEVPEAAPAISLVTVEHRPTPLLREIKSLSYAPNMLATRLAAERGADDALLVTPEGVVLELPRQSFGCSLDGETLVTPPLSAGVLDSITRRRALETGLVQERPISTAELANAPEAFIAGTTIEIQPVSSVDGRELPVPGPLTAELRERVGEAIAAELAR
jgi:branched-chain amino acid aminotransferase